VIDFIFMLTHNDATVPNAVEVLGDLQETGLSYVGFKDVGATAGRLSEITTAAHEQGLEVMLEVVSTSVEDERRSLEAAADIGVDWVLGGTHVAEGERILAGSDIRYCPFPGSVTGHPSVLGGEIAEIADHARQLTERESVYGVDLLAYRHPTVDPESLTRAVVEAASGPVIAAGSVASFDQVEALDRAGAWGFTIGGAIFEGRFPGAPDIAAQVAAVLDLGALARGATDGAA
jgi:uncharacterized protein related to proFAR isomerase